MSGFKVGDRVKKVLCDGHTVRGRVDSVSNESLVILADDGQRYCVLIDGLIKEETMCDDLKVTKEKVLEAAEKSPTAKETLKTLFPGAFKDEWVIIPHEELAVSNYKHPYVYQRRTGRILWYLGEPAPLNVWVGADKDVKQMNGGLYKRVK